MDVRRYHLPDWIAQFADPESITNIVIGVLAVMAIVALMIGV